MKTLLIAVSALALSAPAFAQMEPATPPTSTTTTQMPPASAGEPLTTTSEPLTTTSETVTTTTVADPKALIASEFPTYDKDASGTLDKTEFAAWMGALKAKTDAKPMPAGEMKKWSDGAFATADADKSKTVTLAELQTYLTQSA